MEKFIEAKPVYSFDGYHLAFAKYSRNIGSQINEININLENSNFDEQTNLFTMNIKVVINFSLAKEESVFIFFSSFVINDLKWMEMIQKEGLILSSILFGTVFPYIRKHINSITDDSIQSINIPIIDIRNTSLEDGIHLSTKHGK